MQQNLPKLIVLLGPTASGKTDLAISLAKKFRGEVVNADSRNIYRGMFIGTASPFSPKAKKELGIRNNELRIRGVRHHLFHYVEPWEEYSVGQYKQDAMVAINDIIARGKTPILVGGTGLYIWAVVDNLEIPEVPPSPKLRKQLMKPSFVLHLHSKLGLGDKTLSFGLRPRQKLSVGNNTLLNLLFNILAKLDPKAVNFVQKDNPRRVIRALEVILTTGKKFSELRQKGAPLYKVLQIGIKAPIAKLDRRIDARVDEQIKQGLVQETRKCHSHILENVRMNPRPSPSSKRGMSKEGERVWRLPSMTSLGYRQIGMFLRGEVAREEAIRILKRDTRRYARRQMTWFRRDKRIKWLEGKEKIERTLDSFLKKK